MFRGVGEGVHSIKKNRKKKKAIDSVRLLIRCAILSVRPCFQDAEYVVKKLTGCTGRACLDQMKWNTCGKGPTAVPFCDGALLHFYTRLVFNSM